MANSSLTSLVDDGYIQRNMQKPLLDITIHDRMVAGGGDLVQKGARRLRPVEDSEEGGQAGSSSWSWGESLCSNVIQSRRMGVIS